MIYVFTRDRLRLLVPILASFILICILSSRLNDAWGGAPILDLPRPNFWNDFLGVLHIGNGSGVSMTMGGVVFSLLCAKYADWPGRRKALWLAAGVAGLCAMGFAAREFWILSKLSATPTWIFFVGAITIAMYGLLSFLSQKGWAGWLGIIKPAGTATLTCYCVPYLAYALSDMTGVALPEWFTHGWTGVVNCLCFSLAIIGATWLLGRLGIKLKI
jgi:hypothetical protein